VSKIVFSYSHVTNCPMRRRAIGHVVPVPPMAVEHGIFTERTHLKPSKLTLEDFGKEFECAETEECWNVMGRIADGMRNDRSGS
jgi:hypothetical protein